MSANVPTDICFSFTGLMQRGGGTGPHKDGWGLVFYHDKAIEVFKDVAPGVASQKAQFLSRQPIKSTQVIGHIRLANVGKICLENTHPFIREFYGRNWTFAHNGQIPHIKKQPLHRYFPIGTTDSEHAFCYLLEQIKAKFGENVLKREKLSRKVWKFIYTQAQAFTRLGVSNLVIGNGSDLGVFCSTKLCWITRKAPFGPAQLSDQDYSINFANHTTVNDCVSVIATTSLTKNEQWHAFKPFEMNVFRLGEVVHSFNPSEV